MVRSPREDKNSNYNQKAFSAGLESWSRHDCFTPSLMTYLVHFWTLSVVSSFFLFSISVGLGLDGPVPSWDLQCKAGIERRCRQETLQRNHAGRKCQLHQHFFFLSYQTQYPGKQDVTTGLTFCDKQDQLYNSSLSTNS